MFDVFGTRHAVTSVRALGDNAQKRWHLQHVCFSIQHIVEEDTRSQALVPLAKIPQHWYLQHAGLSVHMFASLHNISSRTLCAVFPCENSARKASTFLGATHASRKHRCAQCFRAHEHRTHGVNGDFDHSRNASRERDAQNLEFSAFSCVRQRQDKHENARGRNGTRYLVSGSGLGFIGVIGFIEPAISKFSPICPQ